MAHFHICKHCVRKFKCDNKPMNGTKCNLPFCYPCYLEWDKIDKNDRHKQRAFFAPDEWDLKDLKDDSDDE